MKRLINAATNKPNKTKLRSEFIELATSIRDMSKYEFVTLLKNNDTDIAMKWIDQLRDLRDSFEQEARSAIQYFCGKVLVDGQFVGYLSSIEYINYRLGGGARKVEVTSDIDEAKTFPSVHAAEVAFRTWYDSITVYLDNGTGYKYAYPECVENPSIIGRVAEDERGRVKYVSEITIEAVEL